MHGRGLRRELRPSYIGLPVPPGAFIMISARHGHHRRGRRGGGGNPGS